ncbi:MAG: beta-lactamase family protein [Clostridiales bacterium]|nr:beta-lactamase family protein [Clostridiales bacterium]
MKAGRIRKTICLMLACILMTSCLSSCSAAKPVPATVSESAKETKREVPKELLNVDEQIKKLSNIRGNIWINGDEKYKDLLGRLESQIKDNVSIRGSLIIATDDDVILASGTRLKDRNGNEVDPHTTYEIGSVTKSMTAVCIMKLVEDGKIKLDDTLGDYFPEYGSCPFYNEVSPITVRNLLSMRSGIHDFVNDPMGFWGEETGFELIGLGYPSGEDYKKFFDKYGEKICEQAFCRKPGFEQGTKLAYSNTNYTLLAGIIEKKSGMSYAGFMEETVFKPCGMTETTSMKDGNVQASIPKDAWYSSFNSSKGCGDVHSSVVDLLKYHRALFGGYLLSEDSMKEIMNFVDGYGFGWQQMDPWILHGGSTAGFRTFNGVLDKNGKKIYVIMCTNQGEEQVLQVIVPMSGLLRN